VALMRALAARIARRSCDRSCWEYGTCRRPEEDDAVRILNPFSATKLALARWGGGRPGEQYGVRVGPDILRIWPGQKSISLIPHLIARSARGYCPR